MNKALAGIALLIGSCGLTAVTHAADGYTQGVDLSLSNETANISLLLNSQSLLDSVRSQNGGRDRGSYSSGGTELAIGGYISEADDRLAHLTLMAHGPRATSSNRFELAVGMKGIGGDIAIAAERVNEGGEDTESVSALALGFQSGLLLSSSRNPMVLELEGFIAPSITSFSDAERFTQLGARLQIDVIPMARAYVGFRSLRWDTNDYEKVRTERGMHVGLEISY